MYEGRRRLTIGATALCLQLAAGCSNGDNSERPQVSATTSTTPAKLVVNGAVRVPTTTSVLLRSGIEVLGPCVPGEGYEDVNAGTQVVVTNQDGRTVGLGSLGAGALHAPAGFEADPGQAPLRDFRCVFDFSVTVEPGADIYEIAVGGPQRGSVQFTADDLAEPVELSLGD